MPPRSSRKLSLPRKVTTLLLAGLVVGVLAGSVAGAHIAVASASAKAGVASAGTTTGAGGAAGPTEPSTTSTTPTETSTTNTTTPTEPSTTSTTPAELSATKTPPGKKPLAQTASGPNFLTGIGDEQTNMFTNPLWTRLKTKITRYIVPWDAVAHPWDMTLAKQWVFAAEQAHQQILIAFYHSEYNPMKMPGVKDYRKDVTKFMKELPSVKQYQPWNEANRGTVRNEAASPSAVQAAQYYQVVKQACKSCRVVGLDVLDQDNVGPTIRYITEFKKEVRHLHMQIPQLWGVHDYSDTNRFSETRTEAILRAVPGNVWLTETGGIVKFGGAFPNKNGSGLTRASKAIKYMFRIAKAHHRIKRLYIYDWSGGTSKTIFDAGLTDVHHHPRPGYVTVCKELHATGCNVKTSKV